MALFVNSPQIRFTNTGSGKTFTMMGRSSSLQPASGHHEQQQQQPGVDRGEEKHALRGLIPRITETLFEATPAAPVRLNCKMN